MELNLWLPMGSHIDAVQKGEAARDVQRNLVAGRVPPQLALAVEVRLSVVCPQRPPANGRNLISSKQAVSNLD